MRVLIIEDDISFADQIAKHFRAIGCQVIMVHSWREGVEALKRNPKLEMITLDLKLPDSAPEQAVSRVDIIQRLQRDALVIVVSAYVSPELMLELSPMKTAVIDKSEHEAFTTAESFFQRIKHAVQSLIAPSKEYQKSAELLERVADKLLAQK